MMPRSVMSTLLRVDVWRVIALMVGNQLQFMIDVHTVSVIDQVHLPVDILHWHTVTVLVAHEKAVSHNGARLLFPYLIMGGRKWLKKVLLSIFKQLSA